ncbi:MAG: mechanosensitive ion channel [Candidatus Promineifilaceae bacterium]
MRTFLETVQSLALTYGLNLLAAIVIFIIGRWAAKFLANILDKALQKADVSPALIGFLRSLAYYAILIITIVAALDRLGVQTTSFVAILGAAGLAVGLALEGALANFAAGALILFLRPFKIGDLVEIAGKLGTVEEIQIFNTIIVSPDNKTIIIPNAQVTGDTITNYSRKGTVRLDMTFGIGYEDDLLKAKQLLQEIITADERVLPEPAPLIAVSELADSSVNFAVRPYVKISDYWSVYFDITEQVKLRFDKAGISIPYPQTDVHLFSQNGNN